MSERYFYGWNVVAATFVMALFSFGLGFYGLSVYVATLYPGGTGVTSGPDPGTGGASSEKESSVNRAFVPPMRYSQPLPGQTTFWGWSPALASNSGLAPLHLMAAA